MKKIFILSILAIGLFFVLDFLYPLDIQTIQKPRSMRIYDKEHQLIDARLSVDGFWRFKSHYDEIPALLQQSVLFFEDRYFYYHFGLNPVAIVRAMMHNLTHPRKVGASTLSMQVVRMMYRYDRTLQSKLIEMFRTLQLERTYTKAQILELYFNLAPYGSNIEGIKSASFFLFGKALKDLSIAQIATLTILPKNPNKLKDKEYLIKERNKLLARLREANIITAEQYNRAKAERVSITRHSITRQAPHFSAHFEVINPFKDEVNTMLDTKLQHFVQELLGRYVKNLNPYGLYNGAAVIIDNRTMDIVAYVGSHDFNDAQHGGQNDGVQMVRSPGSTLKPFIYALGFDEGLITPKREIFDTPLYLRGYTPRNYNKRFYGAINASSALTYSLNIPAINLNRALDFSLYEMLRRAKIASIVHSKRYYGDSIALGGANLTLLELAKLYASLANGGEFKEAHYQQNKPITPPTKLFSAQASYLVANILASSSRMNFNSVWESSKSIPKIAFKTGTSANSRDLLTVGFTPEYSVAVWLGNFSYAKTKNLTGIQSASLVVSHIFNYLSGELSWFAKPEGIVSKEVCIDGVQFDSCQKKALDEVIEGVFLWHSCTNFRHELYRYLQERVDMSTLSQNGCLEQIRQQKPLIAKPYDGEILVQNRLLPKEFNKIELKCYANSDTIYWLIDESLSLKSSAKESTFVALDEGLHNIWCIDAYSHASKSQIIIKKE